MRITHLKWGKKGIVIFLGIFCTLFVLEHGRRILSCRSRLMALRSTFQDYRHDHNWDYPLDITSSASWRFDGGSLSTDTVNMLLSCPGAHPQGRGPQDLIDYTYIDWQRFLGTNAVPGEYPLIYDRKLSNHLGLGINVSTVNGRCFWDFRAHWLKGFIAKHPEFHLSFPQ
jgi:hypothetical protein